MRAGLIAAAHHQLHAAVILIWDNLNTHVSAVMRTFINAHDDWLTVIRLPAYAPDLTPAQGAWANLKNGPGNLAARDADQPAAVVSNRLKRIQYQPALIGGFLAQTGLSLEPASCHRMTLRYSPYSEPADAPSRIRHRRWAISGPLTR